MENLVSICMPVYNGEAFLAESLESVIKQDYTDLEILLIDDCSSDNSVSIAQSFAKKDPRINVIQNTSNLGLVGNWNKCISIASGKWFKLHFQDDLMEPDCISKMLFFAQKNNCELVLSDRAYFYEIEVTAKQKEYYDVKLKRINSYITDTRVISSNEIADIFTRDFLGHNFLGEPIVGLINSEVFGRYGNYDPQLKQVCDFEFWLRIALNEDFGYINEPLTRFRVHDSSQTARNKKSKKNNHAVSTRVTDRIHLGLKILSSKYYHSYRQHITTTFPITTQSLVEKKFTEFIISTGYFTSKKFFQPEALDYFSYNTLDLTKALYNDFSRFVSSEINTFK